MTTTGVPETGGSIAEQALVDLLKHLKTGAISFEDAARKYSQSPSAEQGGKIGWVSGGADLPRPVADLALQKRSGEYAGPISSHLGWHLLRVDNVVQGEVAYEDFEDHVRLRRDAADFLFDRLVREAYEEVSVQWTDSEFRAVSESFDRLLTKP